MAQNFTHASDFCVLRIQHFNKVSCKNCNENSRKVRVYYLCFFASLGLLVWRFLHFFNNKVAAFCKFSRQILINDFALTCCLCFLRCIRVSLFTSPLALTIILMVESRLKRNFVYYGCLISTTSERNDG